MNQEWTKHRLEKLFENKTLSTITPSLKVQRGDYCIFGETPIVSQEAELISGYCDLTDSKIPKGEYICFGDHTECLKYVNFPFVQGADGLKIFKLNNNDKFSLRFLYYALRNRYVKQGEYQRHFKYFVDTEINVPPLTVQQKISDVLSSLDDKTNSNNAVIENLQRHLKILYDYWFSQFDFPDSSGNPYHASGGKMVWNNVLKIEIPCGWEVSSLTNNPLISIIGLGIYPFTTKTYLDTASVNGTDVSPGSEITYENRGSRANMQPTEYSVWFAKMKNSVKHLYLSPTMAPLIRGTILSTGFCGLQCDEMSFEYIASFIEHSYFERVKNVMSHGATQEAVNLDDLSLIPLVVPSLDILRAYHDATQSIYAQIGSNICENLELAQLRDWLLPLLINGQASVA